jgi:hypothetical protein
MKIKYALPLGQMILTAGLLWWDHSLSRVETALANPREPRIIQALSRSNQPKPAN